MINKVLTFLSILILFINQVFSQHEISNKIPGERIDGPANIRDTINGKILFSLDDNVFVECTESNADWHKVGLCVIINSTQLKNFKLQKGDTLFNTGGDKIGFTLNDTPLWRADEDKGFETGFIAGYTHIRNIKSESVIENVLVKILKNKEYNVSLSDLKGLIDSFNMHPCSPGSMPDENGEWYFFDDNLIDDISPRDRITLVIENKKLLGIVHSRTLPINQLKTYELIRGHKFTPIQDLPKNIIDEIIKDRIKWYNSID